MTRLCIGTIVQRCPQRVDHSTAEGHHGRHLGPKESAKWYIRGSMCIVHATPGGDERTETIHRAMPTLIPRKSSGAPKLTKAS
jgi:hypothetical protein